MLFPGKRGRVDQEAGLAQTWQIFGVRMQGAQPVLCAMLGLRGERLFIIWAEIKWALTGWITFESIVLWHILSETFGCCLRSAWRDFSRKMLLCCVGCWGGRDRRRNPLEKKDHCS
jgi:hypothetical protein